MKLLSLSDDVLCWTDDQLLFCLEVWLQGHQIACSINTQLPQLAQELGLLLVFKALHLCFQLHLKGKGIARVCWLL